MRVHYLQPLMLLVVIVAFVSAESTKTVKTERAYTRAPYARRFKPDIAAEFSRYANKMYQTTIQNSFDISDEAATVRTTKRNGVSRRGPGRPPKAVTYPGGERRRPGRPTVRARPVTAEGETRRGRGRPPSTAKPQEADGSTHSIHRRAIRFRNTTSKLFTEWTTPEFIPPYYPANMTKKITHYNFTRHLKSLVQLLMNRPMARADEGL